MLRVKLTKLKKKKTNATAILLFFTEQMPSHVYLKKVLEERLFLITVGGTRFYDRKEITILSYLKVLVNPNDGVSLRRILMFQREELEMQQ